MGLDRRQYIGGSDIAGIMGMSRWSSPLKVWAYKTGALPEKDLSDREEVEIGIEMEENVANWFSRKTGMKLRRDRRDFRHPKYDYMVGHIDRWIVGEDALFEAKTTSAYKLKEWDGESIPQEYVLQVTWYLGLLKKSVGYIAVMIGGQKRLYKKIEFDKELFERMVDTARDFWENFVLKKVAPLAIANDNDEIIDLLYPRSGENAVQLKGNDVLELNQLIEERLGGIEQSKLVRDELDRIEARIKMMIGENDLIFTDQYQATWRSQVKEYPDAEAMKRDGIFDKYKKQSEFRVLRTKILKGEKK